MARGEYLAVMDHDDISLPERLEKEVAYLDAYPSVGVVSCQARFLGTDKLLTTPEHDADIKLSLAAGLCYVLHPASMIRKSVITEHHIRYEKRFTPSEDYALWCDLIPHTQFYNIQEVLFLYREHENNTTKHMLQAMYDNTEAIAKQLRLNNPELYAFLIDNYAKRIKHIRILGVLPLLKIVTFGRRKTIYLFDAIPIWQTKHTIRISTLNLMSQ